MSDSLGNRMKEYESHYRPFLLNYLPTIVRLDGRAFHTFCRGMDKPFDKNFRDLMYSTMLGCMKEFSAFAGYVQSDEITLFFNQPKIETQLPFGGNVNKINSLMASYASVHFNKILPAFLPHTKNSNPTFDARVFQTPNETEASNVLLWRWQDAARNSIQQVGQSYFSHKELHQINTKEIIEKLWVEKKVDYYAYCPRYRYGILVRKVDGPISGEHYVEETTYIHKDFEFDYRCVQNREDVLFRQAHPIYSDSANLPKFRRKEYIV